MQVSDENFHFRVSPAALLQQEAVKNLSYGQGFWWMDLGDGCPC